MLSSQFLKELRMFQKAIIQSLQDKQSDGKLVVRVERKPILLIISYQMNTQNSEEQHDILKGWEETDQNPMYVRIYLKQPSHPSSDSLTRQSGLRPKLPFKDHRRPPSKPFLKAFDQNILRVDRHILQKYVTKESERNSDSCHHQQTPIQECFKQLDCKESSTENKLIEGIAFELRQNQEGKQKQSYLFSGGKSQKKYRRRFYAKTKILDSPSINFLQQNKHRPRVASKFCSSQLDLDPAKSYFATQQLFAKKQNRSIGQVTACKKKTFPVFFRELQGQLKDEQKHMYKKILQRKIKQRKNRSHFMISSGNPFSHSVEFTDRNIFPRRFL